MNVQTIARLSEAGLRIVDLCCDLDTGQQVVRKTLKDPTDPKQRADFAREFRALKATAGSPNIATVLYGDVDGPNPHYFMPHYPKRSLAEWPMPLEDSDLKAVALQVLEALATFHGQRIFHGDIKPGNILVGRTAIKLSDPLGNGPGVTRTYDKKGGTPGYWAPEVASGGNISPAGDIFSLGVTLQQLMSGVQPTDGMTIDPAPYETTPVRVRIAQLVRYACRHDPRRRPTVTQLLRFLRDGTPIPEDATTDWFTPLAILGGALFVVYLASQEG